MSRTCALELQCFFLTSIACWTKVAGIPKVLLAILLGARERSTFGKLPLVENKPILVLRLSAARCRLQCLRTRGLLGSSGKLRQRVAKTITDVSPGACRPGTKERRNLPR
jgi:hypothetical protein